MKLQAIKKVCLAERRIEIRNAMNGRQWIGNGRAWYPVDDDIRIDKNNIQGLFDLDGKQIDKITIEEMEEEDFRFRLESVDGESEERLGRHFSLYTGGGLYRILTAQSLNNHLRRDVALVEVAFLRPAELKDDYMEFRIRPKLTETGTPLRPLLAVYNSLICGALIYPESAETTDAVLREMRKAMGFSPMAGLGTKEDDDAKLAEAAEEYEREAEARVRQLSMGAVTGDDGVNDDEMEEVGDDAPSGESESA